MLGAILGAVTTPAVRPWLITVNAVDVTLQPGTNGSRVGVPIESIELDLEGAGGVSSASFAIEDPGNAVEVAEGQFVAFDHATIDKRRFAGWIQSVEQTPLGGTGRRIGITAQGREAVLDWAIIPGTVTVVAGTDVTAAILQVCAAAIFPPGVEFQAYGSTAANGDSSGGIGTFLPFSVTIAADVVITDTSLRDGLNQLGALCVITPIGGDPVNAGIMFTVDFYGHLRAFRGTPSDWAGVSIDDVTPFASALTAAAGPSYQRDFGGASHAVYVVGGNAAGTGLVVDGSGIPGPIAKLSDSTITTTAGKLAAGRAYMSGRSSTARAPFGKTATAVTSHIRPGANVTVTDAQLGLDTAAFVLEGLTARFLAGGSREDWQIQAGGRRPSAVVLTRRLTRSVKAT